MKNRSKAVFEFFIHFTIMICYFGLVAVSVIEKLAK